MTRKLFSAILLAAAVNSAAARNLSDQEISEFGGCYFAPTTSGGIWRMRTQDGEFREFEFDAGKRNRLVGVGGWWAELKNANEVSVHAPATEVYPPLVYNFAKGRLASLDVQGKHCRFSYPDPLVYDDGVIRPLWPDAKKTTREEFAQETTMWKDGRRLTLWFASPNQAGAFLSFIFLVFFGAAVALRRGRALRIASAALAVAAFAAIVWTASRGALLGTCLGAAAMAVCDGRIRSRLTARRLVIIAVACAVVAAGAFFAMYSGARSRQSDAKSDSTRIELWNAAPVMMCASPLGWDGFNGVGKAYSDWFAPAGDVRFRLNLVSDHITMLVGYGWIGGCLYLFAWFAGLALLGAFAWRGGSAVPLGVWTSLGVAASLNVVMFAPTVLWIPCAVLLVLVFDRRWFKKCVILTSLLAGVGGSVLVLLAFAVAGHRFSPAALPVEKDGRRILVNGDSPCIWIVDDGDSVGGVLAPREIRVFYDRYPKAPAIGYVKDFDEVPTNGVKRLVLVGDSAQDFMVPYTRKQPVTVPEEIIFLSPQFPPSAIPDELRRESDVIIVVGEFAARYWDEYAEAQDWVEVVPGAEVYIPGWMGHCVETELKGGSVK